MTETESACPKCAAVVGRADRFCEVCGTILADIRQVGVPRHERATDGPCGDCGNTKPFGEYCDVCGHRRTLPDRDEAEIGPVFVITDRGVEHAANEDAAAAGIVAGGADRPALIAAVVCDGVSSSRDSSAAAVAASTAGVDAMLMALNGSRPAKAAMLEGLAVAAKAAAAARTDPTTSPSCTYTAVTVVPEAAGAALAATSGAGAALAATSGARAALAATSGAGAALAATLGEGAVQVTIGNVGDSRAYWFPAPPQPGQQLTVDDSVAQELITAGLPADSEAVLRGAHTITRWMGADAEPQPWADSSVHAITVSGPGVVLLCSDGLWNYLPEAVDVGRFLEGTDPVTAARALVDHAIRAGGSDNITVIVIPIGGPA